MKPVVKAWGIWTASGVAFRGPAPRVVPGELAPWPDAPRLSSFHRRLRRPHPSAAAVLQLGHEVMQRGGRVEGAGIFLGTRAGSASADLDFFTGVKERGPAFGSPASFVYTLPSSVPTELSIGLGLDGPALAVSAGESSGPSALLIAAQEVAAGRVPAALCGEFELASFRGRRALEREPADFVCLLWVAPPSGEAGELALLEFETMTRGGLGLEWWTCVAGLSSSS